MSKKSKRSDQFSRRDEDLYEMSAAGGAGGAASLMYDPFADFNNLMMQQHGMDQAATSCCNKGCCLSLCKKFITFMISRVGLMIVMVGYVMAGGWIFQALESDNEKRALALSASVLESMLARIYKQIENNSTRIKDETFYLFLRHEIKTFSEFFTNGSLNGTLTGNVEPQWDFFGSVFYCVTLVSAIGYGHITCKTKLGKVFTIIYSSIGIPLMMLFLANTGSSTATMFKFFYLRISTIKRKLKTRRLNRLYCQRIDAAAAAAQAAAENEFAEEDDEASGTGGGVGNKNQFLTDQVYTNWPRERSGSPLSMNNRVSSRAGSFREANNDLESDQEQNCGRKKSKKKRRLRKKPVEQFTTISIGIHTVDVPLSFVDKAVFRIPVVDQHPNRAGAFQPIPLDPNRLIEAIRRMDSLIEKRSLDESVVVDLGNESLADSISNPNLQNEYSSRFLLTESDEDEDEAQLDKLNANYFISDIFTLKRKRHVERQSNFDAGARQITRRPSDQIIKLSEKNDVIQTRRVEAKPQVISNKKTGKLKSLAMSLRIMQVRKPKQETDQAIHQVTMHTQSEKKKSGGSDTLMVTTQPTSDQQQQLPQTPSSPRLVKSPSQVGFDSKSINSEPCGDTTNLAMSRFKRHAYTRSMYSYDYNQKKKNRRGGGTLPHQTTFRSNRSMPMYTTKQLHLIYSQYKQERQEKMGVPMLTTLSIIIVYLVCGMFIFSSFEKWKKLDALYFCFITLSTIGFGDIMPGSTLNIKKSGVNKNNLYIAALYIFIGLILIAMCINLVKNQLKYKIKSLARKFGLSSTTDH